MHKVGRQEDFPAGQARAVDIDGLSVVVCHVRGEGFYAVENRCTHDDERFGDAELDGCEIVCPRHLARFDVRSGSVTALPAFYPVDTFAVTLLDGELYVETGA